MSIHPEIDGVQPYSNSNNIGKEIPSSNKKSKLSDEDMLELLKKMYELMKQEVESKNKEKDIDEAAKILIISDFPYWWSPHTWIKRLLHSSFLNLIMGKNVVIDEIDEVVNTMALVDALILTIPYSLITSFGFDWFTELKDIADACPDVQNKVTYDIVLSGLRNDFVTIIYCSTMALILIICYYLLRPRGDEELFRKWWRVTGNKMFPVLLTLTICAIVALLTLSSHLFKYYFVHPDDFCNFPNVVSYEIGYGVLCFLVLVTLVTLL